MTLTEQLDALIAEHGLSSVTITRLARSDGKENFWGVSAQGNGFCGSGSHDLRTPVSATEGLAKAIDDLNRLRAAPVSVPELECAA